VSARGAPQGYIYVEAFKEAHVKEAVRGLRICFQSKGAQLVPLREMVDAVTVNAKARAAIGARLSRRAACAGARLLGADGGTPLCMKRPVGSSGVRRAWSQIVARAVVGAMHSGGLCLEAAMCLQLWFVEGQKAYS